MEHTNDDGMTDATMLSTAVSPVERSSVATGLTYEVLVETFESALGHWDAPAGNLLAQALCRPATS